MARARTFAGLPPFGRAPLAYFLAIALTNMILGDQPIAGRLLLSSAFADGLELWRPLSALILFPEGHLNGLIGTALIQWVIGTPLARRWGSARYLALILGCGLAGYLTLALLGLAVPAALAVQLGGSVPGDLAAVAAFGVVYGKQELNLFGVLQFTARTLALLIGALALVAPLLRGEPWSLLVVNGVAMALALLVIARPWRRRPASGKVGGRAKSKPRHLRLVN